MLFGETDGVWVSLLILIRDCLIRDCLFIHLTRERFFATLIPNYTDAAEKKRSSPTEAVSESRVWWKAVRREGEGALERRKKEGTVSCANKGGTAEG